MLHFLAVLLVAFWVRCTVGFMLLLVEYIVSPWLIVKPWVCVSLCAARGIPCGMAFLRSSLGPPVRAGGPVLRGEDVLVVLAARAGDSIMHSPHVAELCVVCGSA
jgi:hypothetical protein